MIVRNTLQEKWSSRSRAARFKKNRVHDRAQRALEKIELTIARCGKATAVCNLYSRAAVSKPGSEIEANAKAAWEAYSAQLKAHKVARTAESVT